METQAKKRSPAKRKKAPAKRSMQRPGDKLYFDAQALYITSVDGITVEQIAQDPRFKGQVSLPTLRKWATEGRWRETREQALAGVKGRLNEILSHRLQLNTVRRVQDLLSMREMLLSKLPGAKVRSFEGAVKELRELHKDLATLAEGYSAGVVDEFGRQVPDHERSSGSRAMLHGYDPEQLRRLAREVNTEHRQDLRTRIAQGTEAGA